MENYVMQHTSTSTTAQAQAQAQSSAKQEIYEIITGSASPLSGSAPASPFLSASDTPIPDPAAAAAVTSPLRKDSLANRSFEKITPFSDGHRSPLSSPTTENDDDGRQLATIVEASAFQRYVLAPLTFISFLLGLLLVDKKEQRLRARERSLRGSVSSTTSPGLGRAASDPINARRVRRERTEDPEDYGGTWWYRQGALLKFEVGKAFEVEAQIERVIVGLVGMVLLVGGCVWLWWR
ncbi:hypothetical protein SAICODRAFT_23388 [Saitoella complicata NRRL Y-17804]|uniref:uncharacterized protein n=1 Tax=Saitoella complicata (strain BCRC 22490 / CBS 7301 / JCM 7358 / NBRC 10748 / NRRL Y-17804) TaxID=698492 RepID=UPI000866F6FC|nr:uncharacterized protein SAICODRAFT_23388 [Saitoella complicata NRRL Y-17804]ODQ55341.1 hypothetical protein SAICODRAFT_23388 [Saitoella complicata NRRL Y-17804]